MARPPRYSVRLKEYRRRRSRPRRADEKLSGNFQGVPVTDVAGDIVLGFDRPKLQASMDAHGIKAAA